MKVENLIKPNKTLLGVGPMSLNCVKAASEVSNKFKFPLMLIASRRQIDSAENGGGYVNNWNTKEYSNFISTSIPSVYQANLSVYPGLFAKINSTRQKINDP